MKECYILWSFQYIDSFIDFTISLMELSVVYDEKGEEQNSIAFIVVVEKLFQIHLLVNRNHEKSILWGFTQFLSIKKKYIS